MTPKSRRSIYYIHVQYINQFGMSVVQTVVDFTPEDSALTQAILPLYLMNTISFFLGNIQFAHSFLVVMLWSETNTSTVLAAFNRGLADFCILCDTHKVSTVWPNILRRQSKHIEIIQILAREVFSRPLQSNERPSFSLPHQSESSIEGCYACIGSPVRVIVNLQSIWQICCEEVWYAPFSTHTSFLKPVCY